MSYISKGPYGCKTTKNLSLLPIDDSITENLIKAEEQVRITMESLHNILGTIRQRSSYLEDKERRVRMLEEDIKKKCESVKPIIKINLRGKVFETYKDTLMRIPGTYFYAMLSSSIWHPEIDGAYFIDRRSEGFERILEYLSTGILSLKGLSQYEEECVLDNLDYFIIPLPAKRWDYLTSSVVDGIILGRFIQLRDGTICGNTIDDCLRTWNLSSGTERVDSLCSGHTSEIRLLIELDDGCVCSCSDDESIRVWNVTTGECRLTLTGHTGAVHCLHQFTDGRLCSGGDDGTIRMWSTASGITHSIIDTHFPVDAIAQLSDSRMCSGGRDGLIRIWSIATEALERTLSGHVAMIYSLLSLPNVVLCSSSEDGTLRLWNTSTGQCENTLVGHRRGIMCAILLDDGRLCSASKDGTVKIWRVDSGACVQTLSDSVAESFLNIIQLNDGRLLASDSFWNLHLWS